MGIEMKKVKKWSSSPRKCKIIVKADPGAPQKVYPSVAAAGRAIGISPHHAFAMLSGRTGKRSPFRIEYADGKRSKQKVKTVWA